MLAVLGFVELGPAAAINGDLFGIGARLTPPGGIHRVIDNPIYTGYALLLGGRALRLGSVRLAVVAAESLLLLNLVEAVVERRAHARVVEARRSPAADRAGPRS